MRERAQSALSRAGAADAASKIAVSTFHAFGLAIVRAEARALGIKPSFSIFDPADVEPIVAELAGTADRARARGVLWKISQWKNALVAPAEALRAAADDDELMAARAYAGYADALAAYQAVDFDDLIALPVALLDRDADARARGGRRGARTSSSTNTRTPIPRSIACFATWSARIRRSPRSATTIRRSTAGAARRSTISRRCRATSPACA
jgi:superfamily I DNA/RNA helicase